MTEDGLPVPRRYWAVAAISLAVMMMVLDTTIANIALPTIARDIGATPAEVIWMVNAYQMATFISLLPLASIAESRGYHLVYLWGLALFIVASIACAFANSISSLILARVIQGFGAAGVLCMNATLMRFCYPVRVLGFGIALGTTVVAMSSALGPSIGALLLSLGNWRWMFAVNIPIGLVVIFVGWKTLPRPPISKQAFDVASTALSALTLGLFMVGADTLSHGGQWSLALFLIAISLIAGTALYRRSSLQIRPLVPVDLLRIPMYGLSMCTSLTAFMAEAIGMISLPFILHYGMGRTVVETGLLLTPWPLGVVVAAQLGGQLMKRFPSGMLGGLGMLMMAVGLVLLATLTAPASSFDLGWRIALCGAGFGLFQTPNNQAWILAIPPERSGAGGGMASTARLVGQTSGAMIVALTFRLLPDQVGAPWPLWIAAGIAIAASLISSTRVLAHQPSR